MTDQELIARLRDWEEHDEGKINDAREAAADRIEALTAKLAKAVEALGAIVVDDTWGLDHDVYMMCRATLAEIKAT